MGTNGLEAVRRSDHRAMACLHGLAKPTQPMPRKHTIIEPPPAFTELPVVPYIHWTAVLVANPLESQLTTS